MDKHQVLSLIERQLESGTISKGDLLQLAGGETSSPVSATSTVPVKDERPRDLTHTFYGIGAIIALVGVGILIAQNWHEIGFAGRILVTVGISVITYMVGLMMRKPDQKQISQVMFTLSAALAPLGYFVLLNEAMVSFTLFAQFIAAVILVAIYGTALLITKRNILFLITVGFATWGYYALILKVFEQDYDGGIAVLKWATMFLGVSYLCIGHGFGSMWQSNEVQEEKEKKSIQNVLYGFATIAILGAGMAMGGIFDLILIALIFGAFYGSVYLKSGSMLLLGAIFLMIHIMKLTAEYFVDSIGWPIALIIMGFLVIGVGYMTFYLNKKFISVK